MVIDMMMPRVQYSAMNKSKKTNTLAAAVLALSMVNTVEADDVRILAADFQNSGGNSWSVSVTLKHGDTGWDHYADNWRIVDGEGNIIGDRVLHHPHVNEQPFTRSLSGVELPEYVRTVTIRAHDSVHKYGGKVITIDLP